MNLLASVEENTMISFLNKFDKYPFLVKKQQKEYLIGKSSPVFTVTFKRDISIKDLLTSTSLALGEAYMNGDIEIEGDLYSALNYFLEQMEKFSTDESALKKLIFSSNSKKQQKKDISCHYDIGNDFYKLWLDNTMNYSCAYFNNENDTLYDAQVNKTDYILKKLYLQEGNTLLDIGCGWGFLLIRAAKKYNIKGLGITLSEEQYKQCKEHIKQEGLESKIDVELMDYRDLKKYGKKFDRVVSVGMLEHVGRENYDLFLSNVNDVLKEKGLFLLHFISSVKEHSGNPWIKKYIFPGGVIPTLREIINLSGNYSFNTVDIENLRQHYTKTLLCWDKNFRENLEQIRKMFDERFVRMWNLYLCSCAAGFNNGIVDLHQILLTKGVNNELPLTRWY